MIEYLYDGGLVIALLGALGAAWRSEVQSRRAHEMVTDIMERGSPPVQLFLAEFREWQRGDTTWKEDIKGRVERHSTEVQAQRTAVQDFIRLTGERVAKLEGKLNGASRVA